MAVEIHVDVKAEPVKRLLAQVLARHGNLTPAMKIVGEIVTSSVKRNFDVGGRPNKWPPLAPRTIKEREAKGYWPGKILVRRGESGGLLGAIFPEAHADRAEVRAKKRYAAAQHFGAWFQTLKGRRTVKIPPRPFLMVQREDWRFIRAALAGYLLGGRAGPK